MTTLYVDITNVLLLKHFTGISRVVSEISLRMIQDNVNIKLLSYDEHHNAYCIIDNEKFLLCFKGIKNDKTECFTDNFITIDEFESNSVFFDMNSCWHTMPNRSYLLPKLKNKQIRIAVLIYDIIPIRYPQYMNGQTLMKFMEYLTAHLKYADDIIVNTNSVKDDVLQLFNELSLTAKPIHVIGLGADFSVCEKKSLNFNEIDPIVFDIVKKGKFLLTVGTVEPRKNHKVMIEAYEKYLSDENISLVIVGHVGWNMDDVLKRIQNNPDYNNGLYLLSGISDAALDYLYNHAFMVLFASFAEGFGLPTIEALIKQIPVICSDIPVMHEVGGDFAEYFSLNDSKQLADIVKKYLNDDKLYQEKKNQIINRYQPPKWRISAEKMKHLLLSEDCDNKTVHKPIKQIVFLSARPEPFLETIPFIENFMEFIKEVVVCCPDKMADYLHNNYNGRLKLTTVTDSKLLNGRQLPPDHSTRNFFLRCLAMQLDELDDEFIMCDDDYRPLKPITEEVFYSDGRYKGYYFSDISTWKYRISALFSYDFCHFRTLHFLKNHGYPTLQYSSHQPQVINKIWYRELIAKYPDIIVKGYDEWSTYFNYCSVEHSEHYQAVPYVTLSWPNIGAESLGTEQSEYIFENFYADNYDTGKSFSRMSRKFTNKESILKDNEQKQLIALRIKDEHKRIAAIKTQFVKEYEEKYNEMPDFAVHLYSNPNKAPELGVPSEYAILFIGLNKFRVGISRESHSDANLRTCTFSVAVKDELDKVYFMQSSSISQRITNIGVAFRFNPQNVPNDIPLFLEVTAQIDDKPQKTVKTLPIRLV